MLVYLLTEAVAAPPEAHVDQLDIPLRGAGALNGWMRISGCVWLQRRPEIHVVQLKDQFCAYIKALWSPDAGRRASQAHTPPPCRWKFSLR